MSDNTTHDEKIQYIKDLIATENFCILPFINLNTNTNGQLKLCCNIHTERHITWGESDDYKQFNFGIDSIDDIWNGAYLTDVRYRMMKDDGVEDCVGCKSSEKNTGFSPRTGQNQKWMIKMANDGNFLNDIYHNIKNFRSRGHLGNKPYSYELRLGNQCNLKCNSCWSVSSSQVYDERKAQLAKNEVPVFLRKSYEYEINQVETHDGKWFETAEFFDNFDRSAATLKRFYTTGGEPTLIKSNYKILEKLVEAENFGCKVEFTTNMTTYNPEFYNRLEKFDQVEAQVSIDGIGEYAEHIRYPTDWATVDKNFSKLLGVAKTKNHWNIVVYTVYQALNYDHIDKIWEYLAAKSREYDVAIDWWPIPLDFPKHLSLAVVPQEARTAADVRLDFYKYSNENKKFVISHGARGVVKGSLRNTEFDPVKHEQFKTWLAFNDRSRGLDSSNITEWLNPV
jgi:MoaA/NifB/PqqE/SkfB family radical SAM enzyme